MTGLNGALAKCPPPAGYPSTLAGLVLAAGDFESDECNTLVRQSRRRPAAWPVSRACVPLERCKRVCGEDAAV